MITSFRLRLFVATAAIVAVVLLVVMATGWSRVMDFETERLDARLCSEAKRLAMEHFPADELPRLEVDMVKKLRLGSAKQLMLYFESQSSGHRYRSVHWDDTVALDRLHWVSVADLENLTQPGDPRGESNHPPNAECERASFWSNDAHWHVVRSLIAGATGVVAANITAPIAEIRSALLNALGVEIPVSLVLIALGAWVLSALTMKPVNRLRQSMKGVTPMALDQRLSADGEDHEFAELIHTYNTMLERLEGSFLQASRFSADAAHELKTPLTILRGRIEQIIRKTEDPDARSALSDLQDEVDRLSAITRKLLLLSHADAGRLDVNLASVDLTEMLNAVVSDIPMMAEDRRLTFSIAYGLTMTGDDVLLKQLFNNLVSNAVRYSQAGGLIDVCAKRGVLGTEIIFCNSCQPIAEEERRHLFDRFYRGDRAHTRSVDGHGLGLSLAREIAKVHGGHLSLMPSRDTEVRMKLVLPHP